MTMCMKCGMRHSGCTCALTAERDALKAEVAMVKASIAQYSEHYKVMEAEVERLREALERLISSALTYVDCGDMEHCPEHGGFFRDIRDVRAALSGGNANKEA